MKQTRVFAFCLKIETLKIYWKLLVRRSFSEGEVIGNWKFLQAKQKIKINDT